MKSRFSYLSDREASALEAALADFVEQARLHRSCLTCTQFDEDAELCGPAGLRPPARVIAMGCPSYLEVPPF